MGLTLLYGTRLYPTKRSNGPMDASSSTLAAPSGHLARILPLVLVPLPSTTASGLGPQMLPNTIPAIQCFRILLKWSGSRPLNLVARFKLATGFLTQASGLRNTMYVSTTPRVMSTGSLATTFRLKCRSDIALKRWIMYLYPSFLRSFNLRF